MRLQEEKAKILAEISSIPITETSISGGASVSNAISAKATTSTVGTPIGGTTKSSSVSKPGSPILQKPAAAADDMESTKILHELVLSYMTHHGFSNSAKTFAKDISQSRIAESMAMEGMMNLDEVVLHGDADMQQRQGKGGFKLYFIYVVSSFINLVD